jgi:hypothetical protein
MRRIQSFLPSNLAGYKSNNSCSASTHYDAQRTARGVIPESELTRENPLSKWPQRTPRSRSWHDSARFVVFATALLPVHVQGNQNVLVCLEKKRYCVKTEQCSQLAHVVRVTFDTNSPATHRDRLYTATACEARIGFGATAKDRPEPFRVIARRARKAF